MNRRRLSNISSTQRADTDPSEAATAALLMVEQARTLVQIEEARFAATQARATTLLAVSGVLAGLGGGVLTGVTGQSFVSAAIRGQDGAFVCFLVFVTGLLAIGTLIWSAATAIGALKVPPEEKAKAQRLDSFLRDESSSMIEDSPRRIAQVLVAQLAGQRDLVREASDKVDDAFKEATRLLGIAVASGLMMSLILLFAGSTSTQEVRLVKTGGKKEMPALARASIE